MSAALVLLLLALGQQPARDATSRTPTGTASITGTVVTDEGSEQPVRRVRVRVTSTDGTVTRSDTTDDSGGFVVRDLPAGRYTLSASKPAWLTTNFGAARPMRPGTPIVVADGARLTGMKLRLPRGAVITGVVRDMTGQPAAGVRMQVNALATRNGERFLAAVPSANVGPVETDDTGTYRIYGLPPGDVIVSAVIQSTMVSFRDDSGAFRLMTGGPPVKLAMMFYPGTTDPNGAAVVSLTPGEERAGIDITMQPVPTSRIEGTVMNSAGVPQARHMVVAISGGIQLGSLMGLNGVLQSSTDSNGRYQFVGLAPGEYSIVSSGGDRNWAEATVMVSGQDLTVPLTVQPLLRISGHLVFDGAVPPARARLRYSLAATGTFASLLARAAEGSVNSDDQRFENQVVPGKYQLKFTDVPAGWYPKSAIARGQDTFDLPVEIKPTDRLTEFVVTLTDTPSELSGSLVDATGRPASEYFVVVFSTDRRFWTQPSRRVVQVRPGNDGAFAVKALPAGEYFIAALTDIEPGESLTPELLESIVVSTPPVRVTIADGQRTTQALKIGR
jgi:protocatechuate 3,4-dioxygenase beta subunit